MRRPAPNSSNRYRGAPGAAKLQNRPSAAFLTLHGYAREALIGHSAIELGLWGDVLERQAVMDTVAREGSLSGFVHRFRKRTGELGVASTSVARLDINGRRYIVGVLADVAQVPQLTHELITCDQRLSLAQECGHFGIWDWQLDHGFIHWTHEMERIYGLDPVTFSGRYEEFLGFVHPDDLDRVRRAGAVTLQREGPFEQQFRIIRRDGAVRWIASRGATLCAPGGPVSRVIGVNIDITEQMASEAVVHHPTPLDRHPHRGKSR